MKVPQTVLSLSENRALLNAWKESAEGDELGEMLDASLVDHYREILAQRMPPYPPETVESALLSCLDGLQRRILEKEKYAHLQMIAESEQVSGTHSITESAHSIWKSGESQADEEAALAAALAVEDLRTTRELHKKHLDQTPERRDGESLES
jgi:hypothetical protein